MRQFCDYLGKFGEDLERDVACRTGPPQILKLATQAGEAFDWGDGRRPRT